MESAPNSSTSAKEDRIVLARIEKELDDPKLFKGVQPGQKREILTRVAGTIHRFKQHSGPLPDSETLAEYENVVHGSADRIITIFEEQARHRMELEKKVVGRQTFQSGAGQIFAFLLGIGALAGGVWCIIQNHDAAGTAIVGGGMISLALAFLKAKNAQEDELNTKKPNK